MWGIGRSDRLEESTCLVFYKVREDAEIKEIYS